MPGGSEGKESASSAGDTGSIPGSGRSPGEGNGNPLQGVAWRIPCTVEPIGLQSMGSQRGGHDWVTNISLSYSHLSPLWLPWCLRWWIICLQCRRPAFDLWEGMAAHSSILAGKIPRTEESGRPQSTRSQIVRQGWATFTLRELWLIFKWGNKPPSWKSMIIRTKGRGGIRTDCRELLLLANDLTAPDCSQLLCLRLQSCFTLHILKFHEGN